MNNCKLISGAGNEPPHDLISEILCIFSLRLRAIFFAIDYDSYVRGPTGECIFLGSNSSTHMPLNIRPGTCDIPLGPFHE